MTSKPGQFTREDFIAWSRNILLFSAPALAIYFGQLAAGVDYRIAGGVALLAFWGAIADFFKKYSGENKY